MRSGMRQRPCRSFFTRRWPLSVRVGPSTLAGQLSSLESTFTHFLASVDSKRLTDRLSPLDASLTKNLGGYPASSRLTVNSLSGTSGADFGPPWVQPRAYAPFELLRL